MGAKFKEDHVKAFMAAGKKANPKNVVSESSVEDQYVEISRTLHYPNKPQHLVSKALEKWGSGDDYDEFLSGAIYVDGVGSKVILTWRMYFGAEVRDNTIQNFENWAVHKSELFDQAHELIESYKFVDKVSGKKSIRFTGCKEGQKEGFIKRARKLLEEMGLMSGSTATFKNIVELEISDFTSKEQESLLLHFIEKAIEKHPKVTVSIETQ